MPGSPLWNKISAVAALAVLCAFGQKDPSASGRKALDLLLARNFSAFGQLLTGSAKEKMGPEFLKQRVGTELDGFGKLEEIGKPVIAQSGTDHLVSFPVRFEKVAVNVQLTLNQAGLVAGLFFRPADTPLPPLWKRPAYSKPGTFREREISVGTGEWKLPGTLTMPVGKGPFPAMVLVHGPGPNDRDETMYSNRMFKDIAEGLASRGIAVLRYDKRTKIYGDRMGDTAFTLQQETVDDALSALALARQQPGVAPKQVLLLGHSLGGYAMPRIALRDGKLAGAIVMAGNARPIEDVVLDQNEAVLKLRRGDAVAQQRFDQLKAEVAKVKALGAGKQNPPVVLGLPSAYFVDLQGYEPAKEASRLAIPLLVLQGERDTQVTMQDFGIWKAAVAGQKNGEVELFPNLNHLFMASEGLGTPAEYRVPENVAPEVINRIALWTLNR